jgi:hypothetical protein
MPPEDCFLSASVMILTKNSGEIFHQFGELVKLD